MPVLAFDISDKLFNDKGVKEFKNGRIINTTASYKRLSPFYPEVRSIIKDIYTDLAKYNKFAGLLFHDDAYFTDAEDFSPAAIHWLQQQGIHDSPLVLSNNPERLEHIGRLKTRFLIDFTHELSDSVRYYQPDIKTARNLYARPVLEAWSEQWFAQNLEAFIRNYDMTAIMAMPWMEQAPDPHLWLAKLLDSVQQRLKEYDQAQQNPPNSSIKKVLFELQTKNWQNDHPIKTELIAEQFNFLLRQGINNLGYYPDDFLNNHPDIRILRPAFSL